MTERLNRGRQPAPRDGHVLVFSTKSVMTDLERSESVAATRREAWRCRQSVFLTVVTVAAAVAVHGAPVGRAAGQALPPVSDAQRAQFVEWFAAQPHVNLPVDPDGAKVLIVKFTDYQCPACAKTYLDYKPVLAKYAVTRPGEVKFVELDYPINPDCNPSVQNMLHPAACAAAVAVRLARERGKGDEMETWLAENHASLTPASVKEAAASIAGVTNYDARYASLIEAIKTDAALGGLNNVRSTPTFFVNGTMMPPVPPQFFDLAIAIALDKAGA